MKKRKCLCAFVAMLAMTATLSLPVLAAGNVSPARTSTTPPPRPSVVRIPNSLEVNIFDDDVPLAGGPQTGYDD